MAVGAVHGTFSFVFSGEGPPMKPVQGRVVDVRPQGEARAPAETDGSSEESLSSSEQADLDRLRQRDAEVRRHEQAHISAGGSLVNGGASFDYETGPDGKRYAVGGEVSISVSEGSTPEETISRAQTIRRAALAPASPSPADRRVASKAAAMAAAAQKELAMKETEEAEDSDHTSASRSILPPSPATVRRAYESYSASSTATSATLDMSV